MHVDNKAMIMKALDRQAKARAARQNQLDLFEWQKAVIRLFIRARNAITRSA